MRISRTELFVSLGYDSASRLQTVTAGTRSATYGYLANSPLLSQITFKNGTDVRLTTTRQYDYLNRLLQTASAPSASGELPVAFGYGHNPANQRVRAALADGSYWLYRYDALGQVTSGKRYWSDHTPVPGQQFEYTFDDIGNRTQTRAGGDASGGSLRHASYTADAANMYGERAAPGAVDILGLAAAAAVVTVNGDTNVYRRGEYDHRTVSLDNTNAGAVLSPMTVTATLAGYAPQTQAGDYFLPSAAEYYYHDEDGNTWADGRWVYTWDAENRLIEAEMWAAVPETALRHLAFAYDDRGRRIRKEVYAWATDHWQLITEHRFLYDGWNLVAILDAQSTLLQSFAWGTDLSGTLTGAGGLGGLLSMTDYQPGTAGTYFYAYDGNGNVAGLVSAADGKVAAAYEYGPFGEVIRASGPLARVNPFRFSTKYQDEETGFLYYGYRYYNPSTGKWLSRDSLGETGGRNLYGFLVNDTMNRHDRLGLMHSFSGIGTTIKYYCKCGWVDEDHFGTGGMWNDIDAAMTQYERNRARNEFPLRQKHGRFGIEMGRTVYYRLTYDGHLVGKERLELACGIFMDVQKRFEAFQGTFLGGADVHSSSFSVEDLPSNFLGFMKAAKEIDDVESVCGEPLSRLDSRRMWYYGEGPRKNKTHVPLPWTYMGSRTSYRLVGNVAFAQTDNDPERRGRPPAECDPCKGKKGKVPSLFTDYKCRFDSTKVTIVHVD